MVFLHFKIQTIEDVAGSPVPKNLYNRTVINANLTL
jgi:hypothetical protein